MLKEVVDLFVGWQIWGAFGALMLWAFWKPLRIQSPLPYSVIFIMWMFWPAALLFAALIRFDLFMVMRKQTPPASEGQKPEQPPTGAPTAKPHKCDHCAPKLH